MNLGQLLSLLRAKYLVDARGCNQVTGMPFKVEDLEWVFNQVLEELQRIPQHERPMPPGPPPVYPVTGADAHPEGHTIEEVTR